jgi:hypothetical protein
LAPRVSGVFHDDAIYVATAKALADGQGYRLINLPDAPHQTKFPILYPAVLSVIWKIWPAFPANLLAMQLVSLASAATAAAVMFLYVVRFGYCSRLTGALAVGLAATSPALLYLATLTLSEMPFALLLIIALWRAEADVRSDGSRTRVGQIATGVLIGLPYLCRMLGAPLIVATVGLLAWRHKPVLWTLVGWGVVVGPWILWSHPPSVAWDDNAIIGYYTDYMAGWSWLSRDAARVAFANLLYVARDTSGLLFGAVGPFAQAPIPYTAPLLLIVSGLAWFAIGQRAMEGRLLPWFLLLYGCVLIVWPMPPWRFVAPILPLLTIFLASHIAGMARRLSNGRRYRSILVTAAAVVLAGNLSVNLSIGRASHRDGMPYLSSPGAPGFTPRSWQAYEDLFSWIRLNTEKDDVVASGMDTMIALYTERAAFRPYVYRPAEQLYGAPPKPTDRATEFLEILKRNRATYLVDLPVAAPFERLVNQVSQSHPQTLVPVYRGIDPRFTVFEIRWQP